MGSKPFPRALEGGLSPTSVGILISKSLGTLWIFGSVKVTRPKIKHKIRRGNQTSNSNCISEFSLKIYALLLLK